MTPWVVLRIIGGAALLGIALLLLALAVTAGVALIAAERSSSASLVGYRKIFESRE